MQVKTETKNFVHPELGHEVTAIGGHYVFDKEIRLPFNGRELLYFLGYAVFDFSCCGVGGCAYVLVAGFVKQWKYKTNQDGFYVSKMNPVRNQLIQKDIRKLIEKKEMVYQVRFD
jgi:hypothetical protein